MPADSKDVFNPDSTSVRMDEAIGDAEVLRVGPAEFPQLLCRLPDRAQALGARATRLRHGGSAGQRAILERQ